MSGEDSHGRRYRGADPASTEPLIEMSGEVALRGERGIADLASTEPLIEMSGETDGGVDMTIAQMLQRSRSSK